jgi:hypothetical protein
VDRFLRRVVELRELEQAEQLAAIRASQLAGRRWRRKPKSQPEPEVTMSEQKMCPKCGKPLRGNNRSGIHIECRVDEQPERSSASKAAKSFRLLTRALGKDPDELVNAFMARWIERLQSKVPEYDE